MGNRAIIKPCDMNIGIYIHWNGGRDSVEAFLKYCELKGVRGFGRQSPYALARLSQVIGNFFGGTLSIGITFCDGMMEDARGIDNGIYIVRGWEIERRVWGGYAEQYGCPMTDILIGIDKAQPEGEQLGEGYITAELVSPYDLEIGDRVYRFSNYDDKPSIYEVVGIGADKVVNGQNVNGIPYINRYGNADGDYSWNINNYLMDDQVRRAK